MVNRNDRDWMIWLIEGRLEGRLGLGEFADKMSEIHEATNDASIGLCHVYLMQWFDVWDEWEVVEDEREKWDAVQRVLLFLHSNETLVVERFWKWSWRQVAGLLLLMFWFGCVWQYGFGYVFTGMGWVHVVMSVALSAVWYWRDVEVDWLWLGRGMYAKASQPFGDVREMRGVRRQIEGLKKKRCKQGQLVKRPKTWFGWLWRGLVHLMILGVVSGFLVVCVWASTYLLPMFYAYAVWPTRIEYFRLSKDRQAEIVYDPAVRIEL